MCYYLFHLFIYYIIESFTIPDTFLYIWSLSPNPIRPPLPDTPGSILETEMNVTLLVDIVQNPSPPCTRPETNFPKDTTDIPLVTPRLPSLGPCSPTSHFRPLPLSLFISLRLI